MRTQEFSECCFIPVFKTGDAKYQHQSRCGGCGCICNVIVQKDMTGCDELILTDIPAHYDYVMNVDVTRVDFNKPKEFYLEDVKMVDSVGREI